MSTREKQRLRAAVRGRFPGRDVRDEESRRICERVLAWPTYRRAKVVAGYVPLPREADVTPILTDALASGKTLLLPRVEGERLMTLRRVESLDRLVANRWGLLEPEESAEIVPAGAAELLLVPLEAVDASRARLGKGGGYYDALLKATDGVALGVALSWQWVERVPRDKWDMPLQAVADQNGIQ